MSEPEFGDLVSFTKVYRRFVLEGTRSHPAYPRRDSGRYGRPYGSYYGLPGDPHPDSLDQTSAGEGAHHGLHRECKVRWRRVGVDPWHPDEEAPLSGIYGGICLKQEGVVGLHWEEGIGHSWKFEQNVRLAEVMVRGVGRPLMVVVHPDDLTHA